MDINVPKTAISKSLYWLAIHNMQVQKDNQVHEPALPIKVLPDVCAICRKLFQMLLQI